MKVLVVEDEEELRETIILYLREEGFICEEAENLMIASEKLNLYEYDCLLVDIGLPDGNGLELVQNLKQLHPGTGILIISAKNSIYDKINGLDLGADDYLSKPFHISELNSRIKSVIRRLKFNGKNEISAGKLRIFPEKRQVFAGQDQILLTKKEFDLLVYFVSNARRVLTKEAIVEHLWGDFADSSDSFDFVYSHIKNLRRKVLEKTGSDYIQNVYGSGYMFNPEEINDDETAK